MVVEVSVVEEEAVDSAADVDNLLEAEEASVEAEEDRPVDSEDEVRR